MHQRFVSVIAAAAVRVAVVVVAVVINGYAFV